MAGTDQTSRTWSSRPGAAVPGSPAIPPETFCLYPDGVNPVGAIYEPLTDDVFGAGLADANLDQAAFNSVRTALFNLGFRIGVNQTTQTDLRGFLASVLEYFDGFLVRKGTQISIGFWSTGAIDTTALPVLGSSDLVGEPRLHPNGWDDCVTEVNVVFKDSAQYYHDTLASVRNSGLQQVLGEYRPAYLQRPFLIDAIQANTYATQYLQRFARPGISGDADFKLDSIEAIEDATGKPIVGQRVKLDVAAIGEEIVVRVLECEYPGDEGPFFCTLTLELERSIWPTVFVQPPPGKIDNFKVRIPNIVNHKLVELPSGLKKSVDLQIAILAQRPAKSIVGFHVWDSNDNVTFVQQPYPSVFGPYGTLKQAYGITAKDDVGGTFHVTLFGVDLLPDTVKQDKYAFTCLVFVDNEIMSIGAWSTYWERRLFDQHLSRPLWNRYRVPRRRRESLFYQSNRLARNGRQEFYRWRSGIFQAATLRRPPGFRPFGRDLVPLHLYRRRRYPARPADANDQLRYYQHE